MKHIITHSRMLAYGLALCVAPMAWANDPDKKFQKMDTNGDGQISRAEHSAGAQRMFGEMDTNSDGIVTTEELAAKKSDYRGGDQNRGELSASDKIKAVDQNSDGRLTAAEHTAGSEEMFVKMYINVDGSLRKY